jgi:hypothetical protein
MDGSITSDDLPDRTPLYCSGLVMRPMALPLDPKYGASRTVTVNLVSRVSRLVRQPEGDDRLASRRSTSKPAPAGRKPQPTA